MVSEFMKNQGLHPQCINFDVAVSAFRAEIESGLRGGVSSLAMLPTYLSGEKKPKNGRRVLALDVGGTNIRAALVRFQDGRPIFEEVRRSHMPERETAKDEFFDGLAERIAFAAADCDGIGFCFSYLMDALPDGDARLKRLSKRVKIKDAEGTLLGAELKRAFSRRGIDFGGRVTVLNDSSALLLGGMTLSAADEGGFAGFILGTGVNSCYLERTANIARRGAYAEPNMIVNLESGAYSGVSQSAADAEVDVKSGSNGEKRFEKMVGGAYLADIFEETLRRAFEEKVFSGELLGRIDMGEASRFCVSPDVSELEKLTDSPARLRELFTLLFERNAKLCAVNIAAIAGKCARNGAASVIIDGSTYYKNETLRKSAERYLSEYSAREGLDLRLLRFDEAVLTGAAVSV